MEGPLSPVAWLMIAVAAATGAWVYFAVKETDGDKRDRMRRLIVFVASFGTGIVVTPGACEYFSLKSPYQHILVAFLVALIGTPLCRALVYVTESDAVQWVRRLAARMLGIKAEDGGDDHRGPGTGIDGDGGCDEDRR